MKSAILRRRTWKKLNETVKLSSTFEVSRETLFIKRVLLFNRILFILSAKYEYRKFFDKSALVASKLGHSRSASSTRVPPSAPLSQPVSLPRSSAHTTKPHVAASNAPTSSYTFPPSAPLPQPVSLPRSSAHTTKPHVVASTSSYTAPPPKPPQMYPTAQPPQPSMGVWDDMNSLKGNNIQNSSLPLQYQQPTYSQGSPSMQLPTVNGASGANNYFVGVPASGMGLNPYQADQVRTNPFSQQQSRPSFAPSSITSTYPTTPTMSSQPFGQQSFSVSQSSASLPVSPSYYNPQPQNSMQIQNPSGQGFISESPNHLFPSAQSTGQPQFPPQSHNSIPQQQYISHSPQPMQSSPNPQYMYQQNPGPAQSQMPVGGHNVSGQSQFLGMTTMQMQQQQQQMQQQQMQQQQMQQQQQPQQLGQNYYPSMQPQTMSHQVNSQTSVYPQGGFPPQSGGGHWSNTM